MSAISQLTGRDGPGNAIGRRLMLGLSMLTMMSALGMSALPMSAMASGPSNTHSSANNTNGRIAWGQFIPYTGFGIFSVEPNGSDLRQLTFPDPGAFDDSHANWSPDGSRIIFERDYTDDQAWQIFRVNADGHGLIQLGDCTGDCLSDAFPAYSPDGKKIAFIRFIGPVRADNNATSGGVWIMNANGSNPMQITQLDLPTVTENYTPNWSPDGRRLVFTQANLVAEPLGRQAVFVANVDGSGKHRITPWELDATDGDWSPDGTEILVTSHHDIVPPGKEQLYMVHPDGSHLVKVIPKGLTHPANIGGKFSPDGQKIVFRHQSGPYSDPISLAYTMNLDGSNVKLVLLLDVFVDAPNWGTHP